MELNRDFNDVLHERGRNMKEILSSLMAQRTALKVVSEFLFVTFNMLSSLEGINSFYYLDVDALVSLTRPALKNIVDGPKSTVTMSETETVLCVVQILLERLSVFVHKRTILCCI